MKVKFFEVRDRGTALIVMAISGFYTGSHDARRLWLLERAGYYCQDDVAPQDVVTLVNVTGGRVVADDTGRAQAHAVSDDPYRWGGRTLPTAHRYILEHWDTLTEDDVIDVEHILGETERKKTTEMRK